MDPDEAYAFQLLVQGSNLAATYTVAVDSSNLITGATVAVQPVPAGATYVSQSGFAIAVLAPQSTAISCGFSVATSANHISGTLSVSPVLTVPVVLTFFGGGKQTGIASLVAGQASVPFAFSIKAGDAIPADQIAQQLAKLAPRP